MRKNIFILFFTCFLFAVSCPVSHAEETAFTESAVSKEPIVVNGDKVEYFHDTKEVVGSGNISINYRDVVLTCDKIKVYLDTREAIAEGDVKVSQKGAYFTGERMNYNFDTRKGKVLQGYLNARPFYGKAGSVEKIENKDQFNLDKGYVTTCDLQRPHYRLQARQVRIYLDDKIVAKHIAFMIGNTPVLYWPYYVQSLKDRKTHITVIPGQSKEWGYYGLMSYRYNINDNNRGDVLLDYRSKKGLAAGVNHYYTLPELGDGAFKVYYTRENNGWEFENTGLERLRYRYQWRHRWEVSEDTLAVAEFNKLSDRDVIKDYFYNEYEEMGFNPDNYISFLTQKRDYTTELLFRKNFNDFETVVERLPEYRIDIPNYRLFEKLPLYYKANASAVYLNQTFDRTITAQKDIAVARIDAYNQLSYSARLFKAWNITPYAGTEDTYYSRNRWGDTNLVRTVFRAGVDNSIKFYRIYDVETDYLGLDIHKLRHIITPTVGYFYTHQPTISPVNLHQFDAIDSVDTANGFALTLENRLQTKRKEGDQMKSVDLATLLISTDYFFRLDKNNWNIKEDKLNDIRFELELVPYSWMYIVSKMTVSTKHSNVQTLNTDIVATGGENWSLAVGQRYENTPTGGANVFTMDGQYKINNKWRIRAYERLSIQKGYIEEQEYTLTRDLHCWVAELTYNLRDSDQTLWFLIRVKAFPEYPIGLKRTYTRPRFGAVGDSQQ
jgi:LPS-assembly protein